MNDLYKELDQLEEELNDIYRMLEASAAEIYQKYFATKLTSDEFSRILAVDPTARVGNDLNTSTKGKFTDWIAKQFIAGEKDPSLLSTDVADGLRSLSKLMNNKDGQEQLSATLGDSKPANLKDINQYSLAQVRQLAPLANDTNLGKKKEQQIEVVFNDEQLFVCKPLTHEASRKFGTGTSWCTATSNPSWYESYSKRGGLYIIIKKSNPDEKWQYHDAQNTSFANKQDRMLSIPKWYKEQIATDGPWAESVDEMAQVFETKLPNGKPHWNLERLHMDLSDRAIADLRRLFDRVGKMPAKERSYYLVNGELPLISYVFFTMELEDALSVAETLVAKLQITVNTSVVSQAFGHMSRAAAPRHERLFQLLNFVHGQDPNVIAEAVERYGNLPAQELTKNLETLRFFTLACSEMSLAAKKRFVDGGPMSILTSDRMFKALQTEQDADSSLKTILAEFFRSNVQPMTESRLSEVRPAPARRDPMEFLTDVEVAADPGLQDIVELLKTAYAPLKTGLPKTFKMLDTLDFDELEDYDNIEAVEVEPLKIVLPRELAKAMLGDDPDWAAVDQSIGLEGKTGKFSYNDGIAKYLNGAGAPDLKKMLQIAVKDSRFSDLLNNHIESVMQLAAKRNRDSRDAHPFAFILSESLSSYNTADSIKDLILKKIIPSYEGIREKMIASSEAAFNLAVETINKNVSEKAQFVMKALTETLEAIIASDTGKSDLKGGYRSPAQSLLGQLQSDHKIPYGGFMVDFPSEPYHILYGLSDIRKKLDFDRRIPINQVIPKDVLSEIKKFDDEIASVLKELVPGKDEEQYRPMYFYMRLPEGSKAFFEMNDRGSGAKIINYLKQSEN